MKLSSEEQIMYKVMEAIYDSGIPISFKGSLVLKAYLNEAGYNNDIRHTIDIDANWQSIAPPSQEKMLDSLREVFKKANLDMEIFINRPYGEGRSAGFLVTNKQTNEKLFTMDIDVNRPIVSTRIYEIDSFQFRGVTPSQIIADKIVVLSSNKIFRRIKDFVDIYYMSNFFEIDKADVINTIRRNGREIGDFSAFLYRKDDLQHAYDKFRFRGIEQRNAFEEVYETVKKFISPIISKAKDNPVIDYTKCNSKMNDVVFPQKNKGRK